MIHSQLQIMELTSVLTNKLNFLEVSRKGMSSLKIILIEMEVCNLFLVKKNYMRNNVNLHLLLLVLYGPGATVPEILLCT